MGRGEEQGGEEEDGDGEEEDEVGRGEGGLREETQSVLMMQGGTLCPVAQALRHLGPGPPRVPPSSSPRERSIGAWWGCQLRRGSGPSQASRTREGRSRCCPLPGASGWRCSGLNSSRCLDGCN